MKKNMGKMDKIIRFTIAILITLLYLTNLLSGTLGVILLILSAVFVLTSFVNFCPIYALFGINTCSKK